MNILKTTVAILLVFLPAYSVAAGDMVVSDTSFTQESSEALVALGLKASIKGTPAFDFVGYDPQTGKLNKKREHVRVAGWDPYLPGKFQIIKATLPKGHWVLASVSFLANPSAANATVIRYYTLANETLAFEAKKGLVSYTGNYFIGEKPDTSSMGFKPISPLRSKQIHLEKVDVAELEQDLSSYEGITAPIDISAITWVSLKCTKENSKGICKKRKVISRTR